MLCFPQYHSLIWCKIWLKPINEHLFLRVGGEAGGISPQAYWYHSAVLLLDASEAWIIFSTHLRGEGILLSLLAMRKMSHGEMKGKELTLGGKSDLWLLAVSSARCCPPSPWSGNGSPRGPHSPMFPWALNYLTHFKWISHQSWSFSWELSEKHWTCWSWSKSLA